MTVDLYGALGELAKIHNYSVPDHLKEFYVNPGMWTQLREWLDQAQREVPMLKERWGEAVATAFATALTEKIGAEWERATAEIELLETKIPKVILFKDSSPSTSRACPPL
jgi:hypothetical protein